MSRKKAMDGRILKGIGGIIAVALPIAASAQSPFNLDAKSSAPVAPTLGGTATIDIITLRSVGPGAPLRFGNVVPNSEQVQLGGRVLVRNQDYSMDYPTGVVFLRVAQREGQSLTVSYRYDPKATAQSASPFTGIGGFRYTVAPEALSMIMGLGVTERAADGTVLQSNVFGFNNSMKFGQGGQLNGVYLYGDRTSSQVQSGLNYDRNARPGEASTESGKSQFILQNVNSKVMGGQVTMDYQDIDKNFANFNSAKQAGLDDATLSRLQSEKGLTRFGMALKDIKVGSLGVSQGYRKVEDQNGGISWRSLGLQQGGLKVNWSGQKVDDGFSRFKEIAESDREQLMREKGMSRESRGVQFANKAGSLGFNSNAIWDDATGKSIRREEYTLDTSRVKFNLGNQDVAEGFGRIPSLMGQEQATYGRELGLRRQWMGLQSAILGKDSLLSFNQSEIKGLDGGFKAKDAGITGKGWSLQAANRKADPKFNALGAMNEAEQDGHIKSIAQMYGPNVITRPEDRARLLQSQGISRDYTRFTSQPFKKWNADISSLKLKGQKAGGQVTTVAVDSPSAQMTYRKQHLSEDFSEQANLMDFERQRLGTIAGLERTDLGMNMKLGGSKKLQISKMDATTVKGSARRTTAAYQDKKIDVTVSAREVKSSFENANELVDSEKDLLASMRGFSSRDAKVKWQILPGMTFDGNMSDGKNEMGDEFRRLRTMTLDWSPNGTTKVQFNSYEQKSSNPLSTLFANRVEQISLFKDFGRMGRFSYVDETKMYDGKNTDLPDSHRQFLAYETKIDAKTSMRTEQTRTEFGNGDKEDVNSNTVSTELNRRLGVAVTDVKVDRKGDDRDEKKRNYGFWYDLGRGVVFSYGYARQLTGADPGTMSSSVSLGQTNQAPRPDQVGTVQPGQLDNMVVGGAYGVNTWDKEQRTQSFSNITLKTARPFKLGGISDVRFNFGLDTAADQTRWLRENRLFGVEGKLGQNAFAFDYRGQMDGEGFRAVDRTFRLVTDPNEKRPLRGSMMYKVRTLTDSTQVMIRDFNLTGRLTKNLDLSHQLQTNPEVIKSDAMLGSITQAAKSNKWKLDLKNNPNLTISASWEELVNEQASQLSRTGGLTFRLFEKSGSPLTLFYGNEEARQTGLRRTTHRYHLQFDQKAGPNQVLSLFAGNVSYEHSIADGFQRNNWTVRVDYQIRF